MYPYFEAWVVRGGACICPGARKKLTLANSAAPSYVFAHPFERDLEVGVEDVSPQGFGEWFMQVKERVPDLHQSGSYCSGRLAARLQEAHRDVAH